MLIFLLIIFFDISNWVINIGNIKCFTFIEFIITLLINEVIIVLT